MTSNGVRRSGIAEKQDYLRGYIVPVEETTADSDTSGFIQLLPKLDWAKLDGLAQDASLFHGICWDPLLELFRPG